MMFVKLTFVNVYQLKQPKMLTLVLYFQIKKWTRNVKMSSELQAVFDEMFDMNVNYNLNWLKKHSPGIINWLNNCMP